MRSGPPVMRWSKRGSAGGRAGSGSAREPRAHAEAAAAHGAGLELAAGECGALAHADEALSGRGDRGGARRRAPVRCRAPRSRARRVPSAPAPRACAGPACFSVFVSASCTMRYAARSVLLGSASGLALDAQVQLQAGGAGAVRQLADARDRRRGPQLRAPRPPGAGSRACGEARRAPRGRRSARSAARRPTPGASAAGRAAPRPAWITIAETLCATTSCSSRAIRARSRATAACASSSRSRSSCARLELEAVGDLGAPVDEPADEPAREEDERGEDVVAGAALSALVRFDASPRRRGWRRRASRCAAHRRMRRSRRRRPGSRASARTASSRPRRGGGPRARCRRRRRTPRPRDAA